MLAGSRTHLMRVPGQDVTVRSDGRWRSRGHGPAYRQQSLACVPDSRGQAQGIVRERRNCPVSASCRSRADHLI